MMDKMKIPFLDLSIKDQKVKTELLSSVESVLDHGRIILGPEVEQFESEIAAYCYKQFAVGMNSGTDALYLTLRAYEIGPGDEVITTPLSWIATTNAIALTGATPVFVDIGNTLNIDASLIESSITERTRAILPVHFTGLMCDMVKINKIADKHNLLVIEDAAQAFGSKLNGKPSGSFGDAACFSMNPMKVLNAYGEAGAVVTDNETISEKLKSLRYGGTINKENCHYPSLNGRIDTLQCAMLLVVLMHVEKKIIKRREIAEYYTQELNNTVQCPLPEDNSFHSYYSYTIRTDRRNELKEYLLSSGIETKIQHPILMPYHKAYRGKFKSEIPIADSIVERILCLPNHEELVKNHLDYIIDKVKNFFHDQ